MAGAGQSTPDSASTRIVRFRPASCHVAQTGALRMDNPVRPADRPIIYPRLVMCLAISGMTGLSDQFTVKKHSTIETLLNAA